MFACSIPNSLPVAAFMFSDLNHLFSSFEAYPEPISRLAHSLSANDTFFDSLISGISYRVNTLF